MPSGLDPMDIQDVESSAKTEMAQLAQWFEGYNECPPQRGSDEVSKTIHPQPITNRILSGNRGNSNIALPERRGSPMMI